MSSWLCSFSSFFSSLASSNSISFFKWAGLIWLDKGNLEGENEVDFDIDEEEAMNEEEMGNEEYNEYLEGEEIDDNIDEINENDEEEMMDNENDNDNEENNGE